LFHEIYTFHRIRQRSRDDVFACVNQVGGNIFALNVPLDIIIYINIKVDGVLDAGCNCRTVDFAYV
jgi:hypothetical protein